MIRKNISRATVLSLSLIVTNAVMAESVLKSKTEPEYRSIQIENDVLGSGDDRFYTNGFQLNRIKRETPPRWLDAATSLIPFYIKSEINGVGYSFGQKMFTPEDKELSELIEDDRPYAGWLYGSAGVTTIIKNQDNYRELNGLEFTVGIIGPSSRAANVQNEFHELIGAEHVEGWDNQLKDELGLVATYVRKKEFYRQFKNGLEYSWSPHRVYSLGNVYSYAGGGMMLRFGKNLNLDIGPPNISPGFPGATYFRSAKGERSWYLFGGLESRVVLQNIFLDGNTFKDSHSVDKKPLVFDLQYGMSYQRNNLRFSYSHVLRSKEFETQNRMANFGALNVSYFLD